MLGMVINTLALRTQIDPQAGFRRFLQQVKETCIEAYDYEDTPFDKVVDAIGPRRDLRYTPLFQVIFAFMDTPSENLRLPGWNWFWNHLITSRQNLTSESWWCPHRMTPNMNVRGRCWWNGNTIPIFLILPPSI